jgi:U4/U6.U5 tri-snRNP-associated protein 1
VQRSRKIEKTQEKEKAAQAAKRPAEEEEQLLRAQNYESKDLKGVQLMHSASDFDIGQEVVLTLADSNILDVDDSGKFKGTVNSSADVLENVTLADRDRRVDREQRQKRLRQPIYAGYDDHEFAEGGPAKVLLPQYDEVKKTGPKMVLSGGEGIGGEAINGHSLDEKIELVKEREMQSLATESKNAQDFYTPAEYATFKNKKDGKEKKKRKIRKKIDDEEAGEGDMVAMLEAELERDGQEEGAERGSRSANAQKSMDADAANRRASYNLAVQSAKEKMQSHAAFAKPNAIKKPAPEPEDDADLQRAVASSRRLALLQQQQNQHHQVHESADAGAEFARNLVTKASQLVQSATDKSGNHMDTDEAGGIFVSDVTKHYLTAAQGPRSSSNEDDELDFAELDTEGRRVDGSLVFTTTTEFTTRLQARLNERARDKAEAAVKAAAAAANKERDFEEEELRRSKKSVFTEREGRSGDGVTEKMEAMDVDSELGSQMGDSDMGGDGDVEGEGEEDNQLDFIQNQPLVRSGMAATLALLKGSGDLKQKQELSGRAKDVRELDPSARDFGVKLEYRDENGRLLTSKEAFRQLCYRFHGYGPGKKNKDKRQKAEELRNKSASSKSTVEVGTMKSLIKTQEATGKAHVVVQVNGKQRRY